MGNRRTQASGLNIGIARWASVICAAALAVLLSAARPAASAEAVKLGYEGYLGGLHLLSADVVLVSNGKTYRMESTARGAGLFGWFMEWRSTAVTEGVIGADGMPRPIRHRRDITRGGKKAKVLEIEYREGDVPLVARSRVGKTQKFRPKSQGKGTMDPLSAVTAIVDQMAAGAPCAGDIQVFDGKLRYDVTAAPGEPGKLKANRYTIFSGKATRCILTLTPLAGFEDEEIGRPDEKTGDDGSIVLTMWFGQPAPGMSNLPVRVTADTELGGLRFYLTSVEKLAVTPDGKRAAAEQPD